MARVCGVRVWWVCWVCWAACVLCAPVSSWSMRGGAPHLRRQLLTPLFDTVATPGSSRDVPFARWLSHEDVDRDGVADLLFTAAGSTDMVAFFKGLGSGAFAVNATVLEQGTGARPLQARVVEMFGSGLTDVVVVGVDDIRVFVRSPANPDTFFSAPVVVTADAPGVSRVLLHDFNGNGLTDVAAAALTDSQLAMYAAAPNREFLPETVLDGSLLGASLLVGAHINSNQDNRLDLVYASPLLTTVKYVLHDGAASFEPGGIAWSTPVTVRTLPTGHRIQALAAANVDGDAGNTVDLVVAYAVPSSSSGGSRVMLLRGNGLGGFSDSTIANEATVQNVLHVLVADVAGDGDGHLDVVVAFGGTGAPASDCSDGVLWLVNDGADAFTALPIATCEFTLPTSLTVSDVDGDLDLDVLVAASAGLFIIPNRLDPLFCPNDFFPLGEAEVCTPCTTPCPALTYDDGTPCAYNTDKCSTCREVCADGSFPVGCGLTSPGTCFPCAALNFTDVCPPNQFLDGCAGNTSMPRASCQLCSTPESCPSSTFQDTACTPLRDRQCTRCATVCPAGQFPLGCAALDTGTCTDCSALTGATGVCRAEEFLEHCGTVDAVCTVCHTPCSPGHVMVAGCETAVNTQCEPLFADAPTATVTAALPGARFVTLSDLDGDQVLDVVAAGGWDSTNSRVVWFRGDGAGGFGPAVVVSSNLAEPRHVSVGDLDGDGAPDLIVVSYLDDHVSWHRNLDRRGTFSWQVSLTRALAGPVFAVAADVDANGANDVLIAAYLQDTVAVLYNAGGASFGSPRRLSILDNGVQELLPLDWDGDGRVDILSVSYDGGTVKGYRNTGARQFDDPVVLMDRMPHSTAVAAAALDPNHPQLLHVVVTQWSSVTRFTQPVQPADRWVPGCLRESKLPLADDMDGALGVQIIDVDGDGDLDVVTQSYAADQLLWFANNGTGHFLHPYPHRTERRPRAGTAAPADALSAAVAAGNVNGVYNVAAGDVDGDGDVDFVAAGFTESKVSLFRNGVCSAPPSGFSCPAGQHADVTAACRLPSSIVPQAFTCKSCAPCAAGEFRVGCGTWAEACVPCFDAALCTGMELPVFTVAPADQCVAPGRTDDTQCTPVCSASHFFLTDVGCTPCSQPCPPGLFRGGPCVPTADSCLSCATRCGAGRHAVFCDPVVEALGQCQPCDAVPSAEAAGCADEEYLANCGTADAVCVPCTPPCRTNESFVETRGCSPIADRVCLFAPVTTSEFPLVPLAATAGALVLLCAACIFVPKVKQCVKARREKRAAEAKRVAAMKAAVAAAMAAQRLGGAAKSPHSTAKVSPMAARPSAASPSPRRSSSRFATSTGRSKGGAGRLSQYKVQRK